MKPFKSIDEYLNSINDPEKKKLLEHIRKLVQTIEPKAQETISYGLPAFTYNSKPLIYFGAFKDHLSIFPTSSPIRELKEKLKDFSQSKGTLHFTVEKPIPDELIRQLIVTRIKNIES